MVYGGFNTWVISCVTFPRRKTKEWFYTRRTSRSLNLVRRLESAIAICGDRWKTEVWGLRPAICPGPQHTHVMKYVICGAELQWSGMWVEKVLRSRIWPERGPWYSQPGFSTLHLLQVYLLYNSTTVLKKTPTVNKETSIIVKNFKSII